jgi:hypothetical protein
MRGTRSGGLDPHQNVMDPQHCFLDSMSTAVGYRTVQVAHHEKFRLPREAK